MPRDGGGMTLDLQVSGTPATVAVTCEECGWSRADRLVAPDDPDGWSAAATVLYQRLHATFEGCPGPVMAVVAARPVAEVRFVYRQAGFTHRPT